MRPPAKLQGKSSLGRQQQAMEATPRVAGRHVMGMKAFLKLYVDCTA